MKDFEILEIGKVSEETKGPAGDPGETVSSSQL